jgi:hypothetical protein
VARVDTFWRSEKTFIFAASWSKARCFQKKNAPRTLAFVAVVLEKLIALFEDPPIILEGEHMGIRVDSCAKWHVLIAIIALRTLGEVEIRGITLLKGLLTLSHKTRTEHERTSSV